MVLNNVKVFSFTSIVFAALIVFDEVVVDVQGVNLVANVGENITLPCNPDKLSYWTNLYWLRRDGDSSIYIAAVDSNLPAGGIYPPYDNGRLSQLYEENNSSNTRSFTLYIHDARITDSARYDCVRDAPPFREVYRVQVINCSSCVVNPSRGSPPERFDINCNLNNFDAPEETPVNITLNGNEEGTAVIHVNTITFTVSSTLVYNGIQVDFNPFGDTSSYITCIVPDQPRTTPSTVTTMFTTPARNDMVIIIAIVGSIILLILIAVILVLKFNQLTGRIRNTNNNEITSGPVVDKPAMDELDVYASIGGTSPGGGGSTVQDSREAKGEISVLKSSCQSDTVLYTLPDKTGIINRVAKSRVGQDLPKVSHDNDHNGCPLRQNNAYEQVDMSPLKPDGKDGIIPLYAMPDKLPGPRGNLEDAVTSGPESGNDDGTIPLYAMPDKGPKSPEKNVEDSKRPGSENEGESPYAMPDEGPTSPRNAFQPTKDLGSGISDGDVSDKGAGPKGIVQSTPSGPESENEVGTFPLYAMPDEGLISPGNNVSEVNLLYAEVQ